MKFNNPHHRLLPADMTKIAEQAGLNQAGKPSLKICLPAMTGAMLISIPLVFYPGAGNMPFTVVKPAGRMCVSFALITGFICVAKLLTSCVLLLRTKVSSCICWRLSYSARCLTSKAWMMILPVSLFVARMFILPLAMVTGYFASIRLQGMAGGTSGDFSPDRLISFMIDNLPVVAISNMITGRFNVLSYLSLWRSKLVITGVRCGKAEFLFY